MSREPTGPTVAEREEYGDPSEWVPIDDPFPKDVGGVAEVDFDVDELEILFAGCQAAGETSIDFIKRAALDRAAKVLAEPDQPAGTEAAGGGFA